jgi:sarcosine oxidase subunit alpha
MENVTMRLRTMVAGVYDHGYVLAYERVADHAPGSDAPRHRLWRIRARHVIAATGALERPLSFAGNDKPGVMLASALRDYVVNYGVSAGDRTVVVTNNDDAYRTALAIKAAGLDVPCIVDARPADGPAAAARPARRHRGEDRHGHRRGQGPAQGRPASALPPGGRGRGDRGGRLRRRGDVGRLVAGGASLVPLRRQADLGRAGAFFRPDHARPPTNQDGAGFVTCLGAADGALMTLGRAGQCRCDGAAGGRGARGQTRGGRPARDRQPWPRRRWPVWIMPQGAGPKKRAKMWLDFQNDVKVSTCSWPRAKGSKASSTPSATPRSAWRRTRGNSAISTASPSLPRRWCADPQVGTTTFRPPYTPISMGAIAGEARGEMFQPLRRTPIHDWHAGRGAYWEPVGHWRRPYCFPQAGRKPCATPWPRDHATRNSVGLLDASTLGKIIVKGPDAGRFMDMLYTNMMSTPETRALPLRADVPRTAS